MNKELISSSNIQNNHSQLKISSDDGWIQVTSNKHHSNNDIDNNGNNKRKSNHRTFKHDTSLSYGKDKHNSNSNSLRLSSSESERNSTERGFQNESVQKHKFGNYSHYDKIIKNNVEKKKGFQKHKDFEYETESSQKSTINSKQNNINETNNIIDDNSEKTKQIETNNDNYKKILCKNINDIGKCIYNNKCLYAHSLEEQNIESIRETAYKMIKIDTDLSHIDLSKNKYLYNNLQALSKLCQHCEEKKCTGGYNCKHGACDKIYVICLTDLNKGSCEGGCNKIHLTLKGLVPYGTSIIKNMKTKIQIPKAFIINDDFFKKLSINVEKNNNTQTNIQTNTESEIKSINQERNESNDLNNWNYFLSQDLSINNMKDDNSICSDDEEKIEKVLNFFPIQIDNNIKDLDDDFKYNNISKREEKINKSIFKIDILCI